MHGYAQVLQQRLMGSGESASLRGSALPAGFVERIFEEAPACGCGCGEKLVPSNLKELLLGPRKPAFRHPNLPHHGRLCLPANHVFTPHQRQLIIASCLGDASLLRNGGKSESAHRLTWNMGDKDHAEFKVAAFSFLQARLVEKENPGWGSKWFCIRTACHPSLDQFRPMFYNGDRKPVAPLAQLAELDALGWAWWYGDDGHSSDGLAFLHTEGYSDECCTHITAAINNFIGFDGAVLASYLGGNPKKQRTMVRFKSNGTREFFKRIATRMAPSMVYKLGDFQKP